jgi:hypothetical protein
LSAEGFVDSLLLELAELVFACLSEYFGAALGVAAVIVVYFENHVVKVDERHIHCRGKRFAYGRFS